MGEVIMKYALLLCLSFSAIGAVTNQELFLRGNKAYADGNYEQALKDYQAITCKAGATVYNMGLCYYKLGDFAHALASFKQAARIAHQSTLVNASMEYSDRIERTMQIYQEPTFGQRWVRSLQIRVAGTSLLQWQLMLLVLLYSGLFCIWRCKKKKVRILLGFFVIWCVISLIPVIIIKSGDEYRHTGITIPQTMTVYSGPYQHCHQRGTINACHEVAILQKQKGWYKIQYEGVIGWVPQESLALTV